MISISIFVAFVSLHSVFACIPLPPCRKFGEECGPILNRCAPAIGKKKRSTGTNCGEVEKIEKGAFVVCETDGDDGLTWAEVAECEEKYANIDIPHPTRGDFDNFDLNYDGTLMFEEWEEKNNCIRDE